MTTIVRSAARWGIRRAMSAVHRGALAGALVVPLLAAGLQPAAANSSGNFFTDVVNLFSGNPPAPRRADPALGAPVRVLGYGAPKRKVPKVAVTGLSGSGGFGGSGFGGSGGDEGLSTSEPRPRRIGNYRTVCVRLCDGYYWPISNGTSSGGMMDDKRTCESSCMAPAKLYYQTDGGVNPATMRSLDGNPYAKLNTAFLYRKNLQPSCRCKADPWSLTEEARHRSYANSTLIGSGPGEQAAVVRPQPKIPAAYADELGRDPDSLN